MADARPPFGTNFQPNRPPGPQSVPNSGFPGNQQFPGTPPKMMMPGGPPGQFNARPPQGNPMQPPMSGGPPGPPPTGMSMQPPGPRLNQPDMNMAGARPPVNGFSTPPIQPGGIRPPGMGQNLPNAGPVRGPMPPSSQQGQVMNGPMSAQTAVNGGFQSGNAGQQNIGGPRPSFPQVGPGGQPFMSGPPTNRPPGPPQMGAGPPSVGGGPPAMRPPGPPTQVSTSPGPPQMRPPGPGQFPNVSTTQGSGPSMRPPVPGQPPPPLGQGQSPPRMAQPPPMGQGQPPHPMMQGQPPRHMSQGQQPPPMGAQPPQGSSRPNELPVPYHGHAQYSHQVGASLTPGLTPSHSDPPSQRSSRAPSPIGNTSYDAMEGQFTPSPQGPGIPPTSGSSGTPPPQDINRTTGITGRRQYPQMPASSMPPPPVSQPSYQPGTPQGFQPGAPQGFQPPVSQPGYQAQQAGYQGQQPTGPYNQPPAGQYQPPAGQYQPQGGQYQAPGPASGPQGGYQPSRPSQSGSGNPNSMLSDFSNMGMNDSQRFLNLMQERHLIPSDGLEVVKPTLQHDYKKINVGTEIFRCTLNSIPQTSSLLNKARLPLGILIHPFKDLSEEESEGGQLPVIQSSVIVRCRSCRTYINPFVYFVDQRRWKCNLCYRINDLPDEFSFDPVSKTYGDPQRRPEVRSPTIEFIAPSEYMLRPPQPAVYVFLLDVSFNAIETGYLQLFCQILLDELDKIPGDARTQIAFLAYDRFLYFFGLAEGQAQPQMMVVPDLEDVFLPCPDNLLVNLNESKELVVDLLNQLPSLFQNNMETGSALGAALQAAFKLTSGSGGRITVMQTVLPTVGPGALQAREVGNSSGKNIPHLGPATDFYKKMALDCSAQQVSVDLFMLNGQYADLATLSCISKYSAGCIYYYPSFHTLKTSGLVDRFDADFRRYLTRKIGFEAVMRIRCTRGLSIHTFHGNFFVRSTDLLSLPNINPDAGFGMQMSIEDNLTDVSTVCFQAALLYTSSKGERRIRVHTLCLPVTNQISDVYAGADQQAIICLLAKMAVDRSITSSMGDARDALINAALDPVLAYGQQLTASQRMGALPLPFTLRILPMYILAMLKSSAFRLSANVKLDDRVYSLQQCKTLPMGHLMQSFYPSLYPVHGIEERPTMTRGGLTIPKPPLLQLSSANIDRHGAYLMDVGNDLFLMVGGAISDKFCQDVLDKPNFMSIPEGMNDLPENDTPSSERLRNFINYLMDSRPFGASFLVLREDSKNRNLFFTNMVEDKTESSMSYYEFLQYLQQRTKS